MKKIHSLALNKVKINDNFWSRYTKLVREVVIPYQWEALNDRIPEAEQSYAVKNFKIAAGLEEGEFHGFVFQDSDVAKWLEAVGYSLATNPDPQLEKTADEMIDIIEKAQMEDGYLNTYFQLKEPLKRWTSLFDCHELYCAGHMMEAAVAYYKATGKRKLLDVMCKMADHIDSIFGPQAEKKKGYPGHQEVELALVKLYEATGEERYLNLSKYFLDERGKKPSYFEEEWLKVGKTYNWIPNGNLPPNLEYNQSHLPVREQKVAVGHAVRAVYMYTAMAHVAAKTGDLSLQEACKTLWNNMVTKQMYITGGIGSTSSGEAFTFDYDLPNDTIYAESCASIGLIFFARRMLELELDSRYADELERALYNTVMGAMAKDGKYYFYVNPLEVWPEACDKNPIKQHVKPKRQKWFGCACCPPNIARLISALGEYIYSQNEKDIYIHLFIAGNGQFDIGQERVVVTQKNNYPWEGELKFEFHMEKEIEFTLALRIPAWCENPDIKINGQEVEIEKHLEKGYLKVTRAWSSSDVVEMKLPLVAKVIRANPQVRANAGRVALQRGPLVYCFEEADNGSNLSKLSLCTNSELKAEFDKDFLDGTVVINAKGYRVQEEEWEDKLYSSQAFNKKAVALKAIPYFKWNNRGIGEMMVWIREE